MKIHFLTRAQEAKSSLLLETVERLRGDGAEVAIFQSHENLPTGDFLFILGYLRIVPRSVLDLHRHNLVIHGSALPKGKGWSPVPWQIAEGAHSIPFTLLEASEAIDAGDIYFQRDLVLTGTETFQEWKLKQWELTYRMVIEFIERYPDHAATPQSGSESFYERRTPEDDQVDASQTLAEIFDHLRICDPDRFPAWFEMRGRRFNLRIEPRE
jgi:methionyl-tRNA formyltransferase